MNCEKIGELLPDYLQGRLSEIEAETVKSHLAECAACGEEVALWKNLALLPTEIPSNALRSNFEAMLEGFRGGQSGKTREIAAKSQTPAPMLWGMGNWRQIPAAGIVWACLFLACGYFIGKRSDRSSTDAQSTIAAMQQDLAATRQMVALSMLQQQSASQRLEGVSWSTRLADPDARVLAALQHTLQFDNSVDVRLAALDALSRYAGRPEVRSQLVDALQTRQSPLVQVALIDLLVDLHDKGAVPQFRKFEQDPQIDPSVKKRVDWGIQQLN
jgi:anti-sigma factor RsiW